MTEQRFSELTMLQETDSITEYIDGRESGRGSKLGESADIIEEWRMEFSCKVGFE